MQQSITSFTRPLINAWDIPVFPTPSGGSNDGFVSSMLRRVCRCAHTIDSSSMFIRTYSDDKQPVALVTLCKNDKKLKNGYKCEHTKNKTPIYFCPCCTRSFRSKSTVIQHYNDTHKMCTICNRAHSYQQAVDHYKTLIGKDPHAVIPKRPKKRKRDGPVVSETRNVFPPSSNEDITELGGYDDAPDNDNDSPPIGEVPTITNHDNCHHKRAKISRNIHDILDTIEEGQDIDLTTCDLSAEDGEYICDLLNEGQSITVGTFTEARYENYIHADSIFQYEQSCQVLLNQVIKRNCLVMDIAPDQIPIDAPFGEGPGKTPFRTHDCFHFTAHHYILSHSTNDETERLLYDIHNVYTNPFQNHLVNMPRNLNEIVSAVKSLPVPQPLKGTKCKKSSIYDISQTITRVLNDQQDSSQMVWTFDDTRKQRTAYNSELYHSERFKTICLKAKQDGSVPLVLILYYDDFRKFSKLAGSAGALYYTFANYHRDYISETDHLYLGAIVHEDDDVWDVIDVFVNQLVKLHRPHVVYNRSVNKNIQVRTYLGMFLGDTPQRADFASLKRQTSNVPCVQCMIEYYQLHSDIIGDLRSVTSTIQQFDDWLNASTTSAKTNISDQTGIKPILLNNTTYRINPFWKLKPLYGFDIYQDSVIDWFHLGPIGIFKRYIDYLHDNVFNSAEQRYIEEQAKKPEYKIFNRTLPKYKVCNSIIVISN